MLQSRLLGRSAAKAVPAPQPHHASPVAAAAASSSSGSSARPAHHNCGCNACARQAGNGAAPQHAAPQQQQHRRARSVVASANKEPLEGPIVVNLGNVPASDPVTAASEPKPAKPVDRSKGLWTRCDKCSTILYIKHLKEHHHICYSCNFHLKMSSQERIQHLIDPGTWRELDETLSPMDPLEFADQKSYTDRVKDAQAKTGLQDGVRTGTGLLHGIPVALGVMEFGFMGGSMGSVVGEKLTRLIEYATQEGLALMIVCTSGGARMQEGILSLMQMAKISGALHVHQNVAKLLYISILTSPTTGGVTASFGMLGDVIIAEPQALIGFAGRRVIEQTLQEQLPDDFQTAEYLLEHGLLDLVVPRSFLKGALFEMIGFYKEAPFKQRGKVPFGIQHGMFMTTEEKIRRRMALWSASGAGPKALASGANGAAAVSYKELVESFQVLTEGSNGSSGPQEAFDMQQVLGDAAMLSEALDVARTGRLEWLEAAAPASESNFVLRMKAAATK